MLSFTGIKEQLELSKIKSKKIKDFLLVWFCGIWIMDWFYFWLLMLFNVFILCLVLIILNLVRGSMGRVFDFVSYMVLIGLEFKLWFWFSAPFRNYVEIEYFLSLVMKKLWRDRNYVWLTWIGFMWLLHGIYVSIFLLTVNICKLLSLLFQNNISHSVEYLLFKIFVSWIWDYIVLFLSWEFVDRDNKLCNALSFTKLLEAAPSPQKKKSTIIPALFVTYKSRNLSLQFVEIIGNNLRNRAP